MTANPPVYDAIVLAGGAARRLGGADKPMLDLGGRPLLAYVVDAVATARRRIVVGPRRELLHDVDWCREDPPGGGPVAAVAAALELVRAEVVVVLAADLPAIGPAIAALLAALGEHDVAVLAAGTRINYLAAAWHTAALRERLGMLDPHDAAMRALFAGVRTAVVEDLSGWSDDCDTWADIERHRGARSTHD